MAMLLKRATTNAQVKRGGRESGITGYRACSVASGQMPETASRLSGSFNQEESVNVS